MSVERRENDKVFRLIKPQYDFIRSEMRHPAYVGAWGTGKSTALIAKAMLLSEDFNNNLGVIFRKEYTDLRDSTVRDFEDYTGIKVKGDRSVRLGNGSDILFRHLEELNNIQNMNLGWFLIEQAEELDSDDQFFKLHGRLRRERVRHCGGVVANTNGHNWIYKLWKIGGEPNYPLFEANSFAAEKYLPPDTIKSWRELKDKKPKIYRRFVENSWDDADTVDVIIQPDWVERARARTLDIPSITRRIVSIDVARYGDDKTVFYAMEGNDRLIRVIAKEAHEKRNTMETVGLATVFAKRHGDIRNFAVDEIGVGGGVVDRLAELEYNVIAVNSAERDGVRDGCYNRRAEVHVYVAELLEGDRVQLLRDDNDAREELCWARYKSIKSSGIYQVEAKDDIKARYGKSPDFSDALMQGLWGIQYVANRTAPDRHASWDNVKKPSFGVRR
jgi:hypothetical protein